MELNEWPNVNKIVVLQKPRLNFKFKSITQFNEYFEIGWFQH